MPTTGQNPRLDMRLNQRALRTAINAFARRNGPAAVDRVVRKVAFDVVSYTTRALNGAEAGYHHPKRIDTGRLRAAWSVAIAAGTGKPAGPTAVSPTRKDGSPSGASATDGQAAWTGRGMAKTVTIINNVDYAQDVEHGTRHMIPGLHLTRGLLVGAKDVFRLTGVELRAAWDR